MTGSQQLFSFSIAYDKEYIFELFGIPHKLRASLESLHNEALRGRERSIQDLEQLVKQYPQVPQLKNYLSLAYFKNGRTGEALRLNRQLTREHPDFLFGHLNLAHEYFHKKQYDKIPRVLGEGMELGEFFPHRECFHLTEVTGYYEIAIMYFCATGNLEAAESRYEKLDELAPDHPDTLAVADHITQARVEEVLRITKEEQKTRITVIPNQHDKVLQATTAPGFIHQEISWLYENGLNIESEKLRHILSLPRQTLISDLHNVVRDSMARYEYFTHMSKEEGWQEKKMNFPTHAIFLLGELRASQCLPLLLESFRQGEPYFRIWFGDYVTNQLWEPLYYLGANQLKLLREFVLSPGICNYSRMVISNAVTQIAHHHPDRKKEISGWYSDLFTSLIRTGKEENIIDSDFIAITISNATELRDPSILPTIKELYECAYVTRSICGPFEKVESNMTAPPRTYDRRRLLDIYHRYQDLIDYLPEYARDEAIYKPFDYTPHTGRNEPCPCGSGKKYKKCCLKLH